MMGRRQGMRAAWAATTMMAVLAPPAFAQEAGAAEDANTIIVTARRVEERLQDVPISISVYNQEQISNRNIVSTTDLATYTPSLTLNGRYGPDKASFAIRGFSQDLATLPTVGVYFADVVAPRLTSNITSGNGAGPGSMFDLQNVQVLKGPQGTLFGRNTTGGAILLVPQRPTDRLEGYVEGTYGNRDALRGQAVLNLPLAETFKVRLGVDRYKRDGWLNNRSGIGPRRFNDVDYLSARLSILAELTPELENYTVATYNRSSTNGTVGKVVYCNRGTIPNTTGFAAITRRDMCAQLDRETSLGFGYYDVENSQPNPFVKSRIWQVINTTTWQASDSLTIKNIASYGESRERYSFNLSGDFIPFPFVHVQPGPRKGQGAQWTVTEELQFQGTALDERLTWQAGGYMEISEPIGGDGGQEQWTTVFSSCTNVYAFQCTPLTLTLANGARVPAGSVSIIRNAYYYQNYGAYAQASYKLTDQFSLTGGIRNTWDWQKVSADTIRAVTSPAGPLLFSCSRAVTPVPNPGAGLLGPHVCNRTFSQKSNKPTWLIDLDYKPSEDILIYAKYARGYRGGGVNELNVLAERWDPETVDDYEVGLKTSFRGAIEGNFNLAGFWNEFKDQQTSVFIPQCTAADPGCTNPAATGINGIFNVGRSRLRGAEVDATIIPFRGLSIDVGYAYLDAKVTGGGIPVCDSTRYLCSQASFPQPGTRLVYAPKNRVTVTGTYTLAVDESVGRISIAATFTHTDKQFNGHGDDAAFAAGAIPFNAGLNPATDLLNLNFNWYGVAGSPFDLALFATNVTKEKYYIASTNALSTSGGNAVILGEPRMYGVRLKYRFGD